MSQQQIWRPAGVPRHERPSYSHRQGLHLPRAQLPHTVCGSGSLNSFSTFYPFLAQTKLSCSHSPAERSLGGEGNCSQSLQTLVRGTPGVSPRQPGHIGVGDNPPVFLAGVFDEIPLLLVGISCSGHLLEWDTPGGDNSWIFNPECIQPVLSRTEGTTKHCPSQTASVRSPGRPGLFHFTALQPNSQRRVLSRVYTSTFSFNLFLTQPHPCPVYSQHTGRTAYTASTR